MTPETPSLSLIIASLDDDGSLGECLDSLARQQDPPAFEVIVVDQNGDDSLAPVIAGFSDRLALTHLRVGFRGASRARNEGARAARGEWLGFPDDDCYLLPATLAEFAAALRATPALRIVSGRTLDPSGAPNVLRWRKEALHFTQRTMFACVTEATLFVRKDAFLDAGGFDERFGPGTRYPAAEGIDLVDRLLDAAPAGSAYYSPRVAMQHPTKVPPWTRWAAARFFLYATGDGALIAKRPRPHILGWGARTAVSAAIQVFSLPPWRGAAFAARLAGLAWGFAGFAIRERRR